MNISRLRLLGIVSILAELDTVYSKALIKRLDKLAKYMIEHDLQNAWIDMLDSEKTMFQ